ncbi:putative neural-cadherin 2 [Schistocerca nitens]|uniref:putative neural-cadherin 2 n=1 Tax=Schistocerca nitens TaxID=7011 RepID=UPI0021184BC6|nr:putative neural-cadherin 2 [Schistocerca nitens]
MVCSSPTQPVTFLPHSYVKFALSFEIGYFTTFIQLRFRTEEKDGELFGLSDQQSLEYAILEIQHGYLYFRYNLNSKRIEEKSICLCYISVDDGYWHMAKVSRYGSLSILQLDDGEFLRRNQTSFFEGHQWLIIDKQEGAHAGGRAENTGINTIEVYSDYRNGCVDDIRLNGRILPLPPAANITQWGQATVALNLEFGCSFSTDCSFTICTEPTKCSDTLKQHKCVCSDAQILAATSKDCTEKDCASTSCGNTENCLNLHSKFYYECRCPDDVTTMNCKFLGDKDTFGIGVWALIALLSTLFLILVLAGVILIYKHHHNTDQKKEQIKNDVRENVIHYDDDGVGEGDMTSSNVKPLMSPVNGTEIVVSFELHNLQQNHERTLRSIINKYKDKADAEVHLKTNDDIHIYFCEGSRSGSSSLSSLCTGSEDRTRSEVFDSNGINQI